MKWFGNLESKTFCFISSSDQAFKSFVVWEFFDEEVFSKGKPRSNNEKFLFYFRTWDSKVLSQ